MPPSAPEILVIHGALGSASQMIPVAEALGALGSVRLIELPGHGNTPLGDRDFSIESFADAVAADVGAAHPFVFGYSMGGYVALTLEARRPGTFAGIVTLGTKFAWNPEESAREVTRLDPATIRTKVPRFAEALEARHQGCGGWELNMQRTAALITAAGEDAALTPSVLSSIKPPVLVAVGEVDETVGIQETIATALLVDDGRHAVLDGVAHPIEKAPTSELKRLTESLIRRTLGT
jgi:pimeloyl-ACP methyl ester carboxylesterase